MTDQTQGFTQIDVLRHGACEGGEIFRGSTDVELSDSGWQQMQQSTEGLQWDYIVSSPLLRCHRFAQKLSEQTHTPMVVDERWREFNFGVWEGRLRTEVWEESGEDVMRFFSDPTLFTPEGGDSYDSVCQRVDAAWNHILEHFSGQRVLVVTHGGIFRALYTRLKCLPGDAFNSLEVPYACLSRWKHYRPSTSLEADSSNAHRRRAILSFHNRMQS